MNSLRNKLHEFGHLLGFDDAYIHDPENTAKHDAGLKSNWGKPYDGYENNLMGGGMDVFLSQIEQMWKSGPTNPSNLYEYNIIDEE